jgi:hypothetical protein
LELLKHHLLGLICDRLKGSAPQYFDYASRDTVRQLQQVLDEALIDFHGSLFERQRCKVSGKPSRRTAPP